MIKEQSHTILQNPDITISMDSHWFTPLYWEQRDAITGKAQGRHTTYFIAYEKQDWVLRHYYRGGMAARICHDHYMYLGLNKCRSIAEFKLLEKMRRLQLPVPKPIAAHVETSGISYRANLIIEKLHGHQDLLAWLEKESLPINAWQKIGSTIAQFHKSRIDHADLNLKNILWNGEEVYLIDFDQGKQRRRQGRWQFRNLSRLQRSFIKAQRKNPMLNYDAEDFKVLMSAYRASLKQ